MGGGRRECETVVLASASVDELWQRPDTAIPLALELAAGEGPEDFIKGIQFNYRLVWTVSLSRSWTFSLSLSLSISGLGRRGLGFMSSRAEFLSFWPGKVRASMWGSRCL